MKRYFVFAFIILGVVTILIWLVNKFVRPVLSPELNNEMVFFLAILITVTGFIAGFKDFIELLRMCGKGKNDFPPTQTKYIQESGPHSVNMQSGRDINFSDTPKKQNGKR